MERRLPRLLPRFKLHATVLALLALALLVAALGPRARAQERRPVDEVPQSRVFGRIVDSKGAAVSGAKVELRRGLANAPPLLRGAALYGFYDIGAAWKQDRAGRESAATGGFGLAVSGRRVTSTIEVAKPLTHPDVEGRKRLSLFAELALTF